MAPRDRWSFGVDFNVYPISPMHGWSFILPDLWVKIKPLRRGILFVYWKLAAARPISSTFGVKTAIIDVIFIIAKVEGVRLYQVVFQLTG